MNKFISSAFISLTLILTACSGSDEEADAAAKAASAAPAEQLYNDARQMMADGNYKDAVPAFEEVERQHPASVWATNAQVMAAYASYKKNKYDEAVSMLERFVRLYPNHESTAYAYYLIALCYYEQISDVGRDQKMTDLSLQALRDVVRRFPETDYARDAAIKLDLTLDHLAGKEMQVGRYYLLRDNTLAAINRFRYVVENYQTTSHVPEALHRLVEAYLRLGIKEEAQRYAAVLGHNFPSSIWYRDSYKQLTGETPKQPETEADSGSWLPF